MTTEWADVITVDKLHEYIEEHIGWENVYDELYEDFLYGMIRNRDERKKMERLVNDTEGLILPSD